MPLPSTAVPVGAAAGGLRLKQLVTSLDSLDLKFSLLPGWVGVPNDSAAAGHDRWLHNWVVPVLPAEVLGTSQHLRNRGSNGPCTRLSTRKASSMAVKLLPSISLDCDAIWDA